jgi:two-component system chemotaxis response regulator CheB
MDGIQVLREIKRRGLRPKAIMVSSLTTEGAKVTTDALMEGALDFILKPTGNDSAANRQQLRDALEEKVSIFRESSSRRKRVSRKSFVRQPVSADDVVEQTPAPKTPCRAVILGCSTGGPEALKAVLPKIPSDLPVPVFVVQHMPAEYTRSLAARLNDICEIDVEEATDKMRAVAGMAIVAPGGKQMKLESDGSRLLVRVTNDPPENGIRPSVDYLIRSVADVLNGDALAVIMTGMGRDGLDGCVQLKQSGGHVFAQHEDGCVVYGMPKAVIEENVAERALPLGKIAPAVVRHINRSRRL